MIKICQILNWKLKFKREFEVVKGKNWNGVWKHSSLFETIFPKYGIANFNWLETHGLCVTQGASFVLAKTGIIYFI